MDCSSALLCTGIPGQRHSSRTASFHYFWFPCLYCDPAATFGHYAAFVRDHARWRRPRNVTAVCLYSTCLLKHWDGWFCLGRCCCGAAVVERCYAPSAGHYLLVLHRLYLVRSLRLPFHLRSTRHLRCILLLYLFAAFTAILSFICFVS